MNPDEVLKDAITGCPGYFSSSLGERILRRYIIPRRRNGQWVWKEWGRYLTVQVIDRHSCEEIRTWEPEGQS